MATQQYTWLDVNSNYGNNTTGELASDVDAIQNSIENILSTPIGSRAFQRDYGSKLYHFIHEPMDAITEEDIRVSVIESIVKWEPRVKVDVNKTGVRRNVAENAYEVEIYFSMLVPKIDTSIKFTAKRI